MARPSLGSHDHIVTAVSSPVMLQDKIIYYYFVSTVDTFLLTLVFSCEQDMTICAACAPPGGGRNPVTPRFLRHFSMFSIPSSAEHTLKHIFKVMICCLSSMCIGIPFSLSSFLPTLRSFIYSHIHWLIDSFNYSLIFFLSPPPSLLLSLPPFLFPLACVYHFYPCLWKPNLTTSG